MPADTRASGTSTQKRVTITISKDSMTATLLLRKSQPEDPFVTVEEIQSELAQAGVVHGIDQEAVQRAVNEQLFNTPIEIAHGTPPQRGENSLFTYYFDTSQTHKPQVDDDGRIDYKNINFIQNVEKGQVLAIKTEPTPCVPGTSVLGKSLKGPDGRNLPFKNGINTHISDDGLSLIATVSGAIVYVYGKIAVNDVIVIKGDVDISIGNLDCRGSVRVAGDIKAGFELKIDGDLEVNGNVEDCSLNVQGNIMVKGGFFGKGTGLMKAGGEVYLKFAEGQRIEAEGDINIGGEVINCHLTTRGNVYVKGHKGKIVGGEIKANKEIRASVLGSEAGTLTVLAVAYNAELMKKYHDTVKEMHRLKEDETRVKGVMYSLYRLKLDNKLTPEQSVALSKLEEFQKALPGTLENLEKEKVEIEETLKKLEGARIIAEDTVYPGVRATFGLVYRDIVEEAKKCMLKAEAGKILISEFRDEHPAQQPAPHQPHK